MGRLAQLAVNPQGTSREEIYLAVASLYRVQGTGLNNRERELMREILRRLTRDELYVADEAFFTGTAAEVTPIRELDRIEIGAGSRGPLTAKIQAAFFDIVNGRNPKYAHWLTKV